MLTSLSQAHSAYAQSLQSRLQSSPESETSDAIPSSSTAGSDFRSVLSHSLQNVVDTGHNAENLSAEGLKGSGDMTQIVTAVSNAQLALQTTTVIRDRMVQAYQDVMKMSI
ncbi:flagellar hook-basal body complex protein FliE [Gluconobacter morbifer]|uniref:Flagellar hook-basal body complex protein FliE n=1 Tax=Gluconobacter morbifer G707 TaxID=1088869 RepID=G6XFI1_9PROT|nr:flagellar hook-basal body complex protein FliE [Gluconobacter morbifer]EHH68939.1 flagellar hook-basal body protein FleE [Gluconobacter morbifer G707]